MEKLMKHKNKLIAALAVLALLAGLFWWGGDAPGLHGWTIGGRNTSADNNDDQNVPQGDVNLAENNIKADPDEIPDNNANDPAENAPADTSNDNMKENSVAAAAAEPQNTQGDTADEQHPAPVSDTQDLRPTQAEDAACTCTISISCATILANPDWCPPAKQELLPEEGWILPALTVEFYEGESVFNVLLRTAKQQSVHLEYSSTPLYNSAYIEGIGNIYEFDCGEGSGWMYRVNGWFPNYGCSRYQLSDGDVVELLYTCNRGEDIGGSGASLGA